MPPFANAPAIQTIDEMNYVESIPDIDLTVVMSRFNPFSSDVGKDYLFCNTKTSELFGIQQKLVKTNPTWYQLACSYDSTRKVRHILSPHYFNAYEIEYFKRKMLRLTNQKEQSNKRKRDDPVVDQLEFKRHRTEPTKSCGKDFT